MSDFVINVTTSPPAQISIDGVEDTLILAGNGISPQDADERYVNITGDEIISGIKSFESLPVYSGFQLEHVGNKINSFDDLTTGDQYPSAFAVSEFVSSSLEAAFSGSGFEQTINKVQVINQSSSTGEYPSAKSVYDFVTGETGAISHEALPDLQGGAPNDRQHITTPELQYLQDLESAISPSGDHLLASGNIYASGNLLAQVVSPERTTVTGNGATSVYAINGAGSLTNPSALIVAIDGAMQEPIADYTVAAGFITFTSPLASGAKAVVVSPANTIQVSDFIPSDGSVTSNKLGNNLVINGDNNIMPNQLPLNGSSVMTRDLVQEEILWTPNIFQSYPSAGTNLNGGTNSVQVGHSVTFQCGANALSSSRVNLMLDWQNSLSSGGSMRFDRPFKVRIPMNFNMANADANGVVVGRIYIGSNGSFTIPFANSDAYPAQTRGLGLEWRKKVGSPAHECRLFARDGFVSFDGTFTASDWVNMGSTVTGNNHFFDILMTFNGATLSLYLVYWESGSINNPPVRHSMTPLITLSGVGVPTGTALVATNWARIEAVVVADGVNIPQPSNTINCIRQVTIQQK